MIFAAFVRIKLKRTNNGSKALLYLITANFIACTAFIAVTVYVATSQSNVSLGVISVSNALYVFVDIVLQVTMVNFLTYDSVSTTDASGFSF